MSDGPTRDDGVTDLPATDPPATDPHAAGSSAADSATDTPSAPWERPRRWNTQRLEATRVDDLLARLGEPAQQGGRRRRRAADETDTVAASDLIAALSSNQPDAPTGATPDSRTAPTEAELPEPAGAESELTQSVTAAEPVTAGSATAKSSTAEPAAAEPAADSGMTQQGAAPAVLAPATAVAAVPDTEAATTILAPRSMDGATTVLPARPVGDDPTQLIGTATPASDQPPADDSHTVIIPKLSPDTDEASSIRQSLAAQASGVTTTPPAPAHHGRRRVLIAGRSVVALVTVLVLVLTGWYWNIKRKAADGIQANQVTGSLQTTDPNIVAPTAKPTAAPGLKIYQPENVLLIGSDTRAGSNGNSGNSDSSTADSANSDTMMIAHLSADRQHVTILSLPRDTLIPAPVNCKYWDFKTNKYSDQTYKPSSDQTFHLNSTFSVGGPACVIKAIQQFSGIRIDRFIGIDFVGFKAMVDALGGITITTCGPIVDKQLLTITDHGGTQTFTGQKALDLVRARDVKGDSESDLARIQRQQAVLSALLRQVSSAGTLTSPTKLDNFLTAFTHNTFSDGVTLDTLLQLSSSMGSFNPDTVTFYTLPNYPSERINGALEIDETKAPAVFNAIINDLPLPGQKVGAARTTTTPKTTPSTKTTTPPDLTITIAPAKVPLRIYNVTGESGVAGKAQKALNDIGFDVTDNDLIRPDNETRTGVTVEYPAAERAAALTVAAAVPGSTLVLNNSLSGEVRLMLGSGYDGKVVAVEIGSTAPASLTSIGTATTASAAQTTGDTNSESTGNAGATTASPAPTTLKPSDLRPVNAASTACIGPKPATN